MNQAVINLQQMKNGLASQEVWDATLPENRANLVLAALHKAEIMRPNMLDIDCFGQAKMLAIQQGIISDYGKIITWINTHQQMLDIFDNAIRIAKLQSFI